MCSEISKKIGRNVNPLPKVSIIIPAYNIADFISETLESVLAQTSGDYEIILINDGSPDSVDFEKVLEPFLENIVYLKISNVGAGAARNYGIEHSRGELIAFLDGDDVWCPEYLESQIKFLELNRYDLVYADAELFGGSPFDGKKYTDDAPSVGEVTFDSLLDLRCNVITSGTLVRKKDVIIAGMFETEKVRAHDFILWLKIAKNNGRIGYQSRVLLKYRVRLDSLSGNSIQRVQREIDVFDRVLKLFELNQSQKQIVENQLIRLNAEMEIERGKSLLLKKDFLAARCAFENGNKFRRSIQLRLIIILLKIAPNLLLRLYKSQRAKEITFIATN